ncbi:hypothetical protein GOODEAATRI_018635 [Goodea atripinnis]|uniref:PID domain-containing protein n=1 Tax=Goodea atripinnis TaxID=208336 RepID=A0ABV0PZ59_9TELE
MSDIVEDESDISFTVKVVRPSGLQILEEAAERLKMKCSPHLCYPQYLLYTCPLSTVSFCAVLRSSPKVFGFVAQHPASDLYHCYLFQSHKFVSIPSVV